MISNISEERNLTVPCSELHIGKQQRMFTVHSQSQACPLWTGASCTLEVFRLGHLPCKERLARLELDLLCCLTHRNSKSEELVGVSGDAGGEAIIQIKQDYFQIKRIKIYSTD